MKVSNSGEIEAKDIQVNVLGTKLLEYRVEKQSEADNVQIFHQENKFELRYPLLIPDGSFILSFASKERVDYRDISILHSRGSGTEAFKSKKLSVIDIISFVYFFGAGTCALFISMIFSLRSDLESKAGWGSDTSKRILRRRKPFYFGKDKWFTIRKKAIDNYLSRWGETGDVTTWRSFKVLEQEKPTYLSQEEWKDMVENAAEKMIGNIKEKIRWTYNIDYLLSLMRLHKPAQFPELSWAEIQTDVDQQYLRLKERELIEAMPDKDKLKGFLIADKSGCVKEATWLEQRDKAEKKYIESLDCELTFAEDAVGFLSQHNLELISRKGREELSKRAYKRNILRLNDVRIPSEAKKFLASGKPVWMKNEDFMEYKDLAEKTLDLEKKETEVNNKLIELGKKESTITEKIRKVTLQLEIIDKTLCDPRFLDKLEDYNNTFAPGNFKNLKRVAAYLENIRQERT